MDLKAMYREIVNEHNLHPTHKYDLNSPTKVLRGVNPSCGDDINLQLKIEDGIITDGSYAGSGCAISQASADMMLDLIIGKNEEVTKNEVHVVEHILQRFQKRYAVRVKSAEKKQIFSEFARGQFIRQHTHAFFFGFGKKSAHQLRHSGDRNTVDTCASAFFIQSADKFFKLPAFL